MTLNVLDMKPDVEQLDNGLELTKSLAAAVSACLADTYILMVKTQAYHWNAVGPLFHSVHTLTEEHYTDMFSAIDELAERIRALGHPAPSSITDMVGLSGISEDIGNPTTDEMITNLIEDHETLARRFRAVVARAEKNDDVVTADMLTSRMAFHEKAVWMLRAFITT